MLLSVLISIIYFIIGTAIIGTISANMEILQVGFWAFVILSAIVFIVVDKIRNNTKKIKYLESIIVGIFATIGVIYLLPLQFSMSNIVSEIISIILIAILIIIGEEVGKFVCKKVVKIY